jgi:hypothetical protein
MYALGREAFLEGGIDALTDTLAISLVTSAYTANLSTDQFYSIISGGAIVAGPVTLTSVTGSGGTLSAANTIFSSVTGTAASQVVLFKNTGTGSTSPLIGNINVATGLPVTPNGGNITVAWSGGQVFTLFEGLAEDRDDWRVKERIRDLWAAIKGKKWKTNGDIWLPEPSIVLG